MKKQLFKLIFFITSSISVANAANSQIAIDYLSPHNNQEKVAQAFLKNSGVIDEFALFVEQHFKLPKILKIEVGSHDGPMFWSDTNTIMLPYGFVDEIRQRFLKDNYFETGISTDEAVEHALIHTLFHEFGHASILMYNLPVLGKEEDAADSLANILLLEFFENGAEIVLSAGDLFYLEGQDRGAPEEPDYWDEHSLDEQRYYTALCFVYGSQPEKYGYTVKSGTLPQERAENCTNEYSDTMNSWMQLLEPYMQIPQD